MESPPSSHVPRPMSAMLRQNRSSSRMSFSSKRADSRASDEDGKTAVKVAVRVRPPLKAGDPGYELVPQRFRASTCHVPAPTSLEVNSAQGKKLFVFDRVFGEEHDQEAIWGYLSESVNSFVQGYNVSIMAYGQSGAGKSFTMGTTGPKEQGDTTLKGVIPRAASVLFEKLASPQKHSNRLSGSGIRYSGLPTTANKPLGDKTWQMKATYVEIYNEHLRDLLIPDSVPAGERAPVSIREDAKGRILLTGLHQVNINSIEDLLGALNFGSSIRQTDATAVNAKSSRSHAVFSLNLVQKKSRAGPMTVKEKRMSVPIEAMSGSEATITTDSKLHFVDLAGSERLKNTGAHGERAKEGISINAGLASLGKVIAQLSSRSHGAHVSYRDSRLTRLLQDSLGGNAVTYMVACINPAEFHLSETLNTVQYAQRARAIQSKPQIQQIAESGDQKAIIERLRAEISFLRDQIRLSERSGRKSDVPMERAERQNEREMELQHQLLDIQENYTALGQRHAKLISEISKARDDKDDTETPLLKDAIGENALDRLKRSNSFAEAVEQVVLEYEKTIQSLEGSLSTTRASLSSSESTLLERETKIAYMETVSQQLQARIQKAGDREASNETYLRDLESRVDGVTSGEEKSTMMIQDLRKELHRVRENEANCEDYITTLEERLAESEHDHEMMQRELDRLEHVIERQRSIGKLDSLLYELDNVRQTGPKGEGENLTNGVSKRSSEAFHDTQESVPAVVEGQSTPTREVADPANGTPEAMSDDGSSYSEESEHEPRNRNLAPAGMASIHEAPESPAQSKFVADKLENVTQELFDLRMEHESTLGDYEELAQKYTAAMNTLSELQDAVDEARHSNKSGRAVAARPGSFLADAGTNGMKGDGQLSSSRTLSSELSSAGESTGSTESSDAETAHGRNGSLGGNSKDANLRNEIKNLRKMGLEKQAAMQQLSETYDELQNKHQDALDYVEELKAEVQKAQKNQQPTSPSGVVRRKSSHNLFSLDRANRSFASLRNIAQDHIEDDPDASQVFEANLASITTELQIRAERIQSLEGEVSSIRKEMESKMTIITGLTRERSSMKTSPMDISVVSSMRDQILENESRVKSMQESHATRERDLLDQISSLKETMNSGASSGIPGEFPPTPLDAPRGLGEGSEEDKAAALQRQLSDLKAEHREAMDTRKHSEKDLINTINQLQHSLDAVKSTQASRDADASTSRDANADGEKQKRQAIVQTLQKKVEEHKAAAALNAEKLAHLEASYDSIVQRSHEDAAARGDLESQIDEHRSALSQHKDGLESLKQTHAREIEDLTTAARAAHDESNNRLAEVVADHRTKISALEEQLSQSRSGGESVAALQQEVDAAREEVFDIARGVSNILGQDTDVDQIEQRVQALANERKSLIGKHERAVNDLKTAQKEVATLEKNVGELKGINEETLKELERVTEKERKSSRLVEELEDQLSSNYDAQRADQNRMSAMHSARAMQVEEVMQAKGDMEKELEECRARIAQYESQLGDARRFSNRESLNPGDIQRSNSANSNLRKSSSHQSLPSPPPAIPLPPLPGNAVGAPTSAPQPPSSPPASRHQSKDVNQTQLVEDQEARIRTIEKHLFAEKQLTATLEEALTDLENSSTKVRGEMEGWKRKCAGLENELDSVKREKNSQRLSLQAVEEQRQKLARVEADKANLESRMRSLDNKGKKKKGTLNCF